MSGGLQVVVRCVKFRCGLSKAYDDKRQLSCAEIIKMQEMMTMSETHPFEIFSPPNAKYLILGSFVGKEAVKGAAATDESYDWFYGTKRNQFWPILEGVYGVELKNKISKQELFIKLGIAIADIIYKCERKDDNNLDTNLVNIVYNPAVPGVIESQYLEKILFTSQYVEKRFKKNYKDIINRHPSIQLVTLPSPSPRYAQMSKDQKIRIYKELLPRM